MHFNLVILSKQQKKEEGKEASTCISSELCKALFCFLSSTPPKPVLPNELENNYLCRSKIQHYTGILCECVFRTEKKSPFRIYSNHHTVKTSKVLSKNLQSELFGVSKKY